jgi:hypothetical protein
MDEKQLQDALDNIDKVVGRSVGDIYALAGDLKKAFIMMYGKKPEAAEPKAE